MCEIPFALARVVFVKSQMTRHYPSSSTLSLSLSLSLPPTPTKKTNYWFWKYQDDTNTSVFDCVLAWTRVSMWAHVYRKYGHLMVYRKYGHLPVPSVCAWHQHVRGGGLLWAAQVSLSSSGIPCLAWLGCCYKASLTGYVYVWNANATCSRMSTAKTRQVVFCVN